MILSKLHRCAQILSMINLQRDNDPVPIRNFRTWKPSAIFTAAMLDTSVWYAVEIVKPIRNACLHRTHSRISILRATIQQQSRPSETEVEDRWEHHLPNYLQRFAQRGTRAPFHSTISRVGDEPSKSKQQQRENSRGYRHEAWSSDSCQQKFLESAEDTVKSVEIDENAARSIAVFASPATNWFKFSVEPA